MSQDIVKAKLDARVMDSWAVGVLIDCAAGKEGSERTKEALRAELGEIATDLAGPSPTPVERVLARTAAISWFALRLHEAQYAGGEAGKGGMTIRQSEHAQRRMDRAHRRLMSTLKTLAAVRRLAVPALQINLARQQVNQLKAGDSP